MVTTTEIEERFSVQETPKLLVSSGSVTPRV
jgi:hypothetical protein